MDDYEPLNLTFLKTPVPMQNNKRGFRDFLIFQPSSIINNVDIEVPIITNGRTYATNNLVTSMILTNINTELLIENSIDDNPETLLDDFMQYDLLMAQTGLTMLSPY